MSTTAETSAQADQVGPPVLVLALGYLSLLVSMVLVPLEAVAAHVLGYVTGSLVPILVTGVARRIDLDRRRSPYYTPHRLFGPALVVLAVLAVAAAGLHVWPLATGLAS